MTTPLSDEETRLFNSIRDFTLSHGRDLALIRARMDGEDEDVAVISEINYPPGDNEDDGDVFIIPLAILVTPSMSKRLVPPDEEAS